MVEDVKEIEVPTDRNLEVELQKSVVCYFDGVNIKATKKLLEEKGLANMAISRFDSIVCMVSKVEGLQVLVIEDETVKPITTCVKMVVKWNK